MRRPPFARRAAGAAVALAALAAPAARPAGAQAPNPTNLWSVALRWDGDRLVAGPPVKLTRDSVARGSSQPSFTPDGRAIVYAALRDTGDAARTDVYRLDLRTRAETRVTRTPETRTRRR
jgi:hypothetical protein